MAETKGLNFDIRWTPATPPSLYTDAKRLQQVLKNLLSNAFKFTEKGRVALEIAPATSGWSRDQRRAEPGADGDRLRGDRHRHRHPADKQQIIFEAFQQADGTTSRKYGGTGLGLAISRGIAQLLGGEIRLASTPGEGSTFTLYLPQPEHPGAESLRSRSASGAWGRERPHERTSGYGLRATDYDAEGNRAHRGPQSFGRLSRRRRSARYSSTSEATRCIPKTT